MDMTGEFRIEAPRERVWAALNDPEVLKQAIPGCDEIEKTSDTTFTAKVTAKVGPVKAKFTGAVTLSELDPPNGYRISGEGKGGPAGFAKGGARVDLAADGDATLLKYEVNATVGGKLAQLGARLIDATSRKMADDFFARFAAAVIAQEGGAAEPVAAPAPPAAPAERPGGLRPTTWIVAVIVVILIVLAILATGSMPHLPLAGVIDHAGNIDREPGPGRLIWPSWGHQPC